MVVRVHHSTARRERRRHFRIQEDQPMKTTQKLPLFFLSALALLLMASSGAFAQTTTTPANIDNSYNHPPCDFNEPYYQGIACDPQLPYNAINVTQLNTPAEQRFGIFRQFGPPASGSQANCVSAPTCSPNYPDRNNIRILA